MKIGITGQTGFIGTYLYNTLNLNKRFERISFEDSFFDHADRLREFVKSCDVIVHLAAMNRNSEPEVIYNTNISLVKKLIDAMVAEKVTPHVLFSSSTQEEEDNLYGKSKREGRKLFEKWAQENDSSFTGLVISNVFGPFSKPYYNTFIATFAHQLINGEKPTVLIDNDIKLIFVGSLCEYIVNQIISCKKGDVKRVEVPYDFEAKISEILSLFENFNELYTKNGYIPNIKNLNEINLFNTFRSYLDYSKHFPVKLLTQCADHRGVLVETIKFKIGGQVSFSTTVPGHTRGNHYHTRRIERFIVIKGEARIELRKIGSREIIDLYLDGTKPSYVDIPIWYTHSITNIGKEELYTQFWMNEWYDPNDDDTYFEEV